MDKKEDKEKKAIIFEPAFFSGKNNHDLVKVVTANADIDERHFRRTINGETNPTIKQLQKITNAMGGRPIVITVPNSTILDNIVNQYGKEEKYYIKIPVASTQAALFDFIIGEAGENGEIDCVQRRFHELSALITLSIKPDGDNSELLKIINSCIDQVQDNLQNDIHKKGK